LQVDRVDGRARHDGSGCRCLSYNRFRSGECATVLANVDSCLRSYGQLAAIIRTDCTSSFRPVVADALADALGAVAPAVAAGVRVDSALSARPVTCTLCPTCASRFVPPSSIQRLPMALPAVVPDVPAVAAVVPDVDAVDPEVPAVDGAVFVLAVVPAVLVLAVAAVVVFVLVAAPAALAVADVSTCALDSANCPSAPRSTQPVRIICPADAAACAGCAGDAVVEPGLVCVVPVAGDVV
jgi:hypothetical protein